MDVGTTDSSIAEACATEATQERITATVHPFMPQETDSTDLILHSDSAKLSPGEESGHPRLSTTHGHRGTPDRPNNQDQQNTE